MVITVGWWILPAIVTATYGLWVAFRHRSDSRGDYNFAPLFDCMVDVIALVPVIVVWFIWALLR